MDEFSNLPDPIKQLLRKLILENKNLKYKNIELLKKIKEVTFLLESSQTLAGNYNNQNFYQEILEMALKMSNTEIGGLFLKDKTSNHLELKAIAGEIEPALLKWMSQIPKEIEMILIKDQVQELVHKEPLLLQLQKYDKFIRSTLFFPLIFERKLYGLGFVMHRHEGAVTHSVHYGEDIRFIKILAQQSFFIAKLNGLMFDRESENIYLKTISALTEAIDAKDMYTAGHSQRVAEISTTIAYDLGLTQKEIDNIHYGALLHDIGKIGVPESILNKKGKLTDSEFFAIKKHPTIGMNILRSIDFLDDALNIVRHHHERVDGKGYPDGLAGEDIPFMARIVCVADAWDAMTSNRSYRKALPINVVIEELRENANTQFDPEIIRAIQKGSFVQLNNVN
ncbi:MAG: HD-GYP domain-containing protein [Halanaerobiales bacterium]|nr:HD-GYP domain-containing protein [Halanaerobiales bacterium]